MKNLIAVLVTVFSLLVASSANAQTFSSPGGLCQPPFNGVGFVSEYCYSINVSQVNDDGTTTPVGYLWFYVKVLPDGTFSNATVTQTDYTGGVVYWQATDWTGTDVSGVYSGDFSFVDSSGTTRTGTLSATVVSYVHKEGGGRVGIRYVTSWKVSALSMVLQ